MKIILSIALITFSFTTWFFSENQRLRRFEVKMKTAIEQNPELLAESILSNSVLFTETLDEAIVGVQDEWDRQRAAEENELIELALQYPLTPLVREDDISLGSNDGDLLLIHYSDLACPVTARSFQTVKKLLNKYPARLKVIVKHLPQKMHANALISAQYYEALRIQSEELAVDFHAQLFSKTTNLRRGESFLKHTARALGADMAQLANDIHSKEVEKRILQDKDEAYTFGIQASPGFLLNGIPINGAYPFEQFEALIKKLGNRHLMTN